MPSATPSFSSPANSCPIVGRAARSRRRPRRRRAPRNLDGLLRPSSLRPPLPSVILLYGRMGDPLLSLYWPPSPPPESSSPTPPCSQGECGHDDLFKHFDRDRPYTNTNRASPFFGFVMLILVVLFTAIACRVYGAHMSRRARLRWRRSLGRTVTVAPCPAETAAAVELSVQSELKAQPTIKWSTGLVGEGSTASSCALCLEAYAVNDDVRRLQCGHVYHTKCVDPWLQNWQRGRRRTCPLCNSDPLSPGGGGGGET